VQLKKLSTTAARTVGRCFPMRLTNQTNKSMKTIYLSGKISNLPEDQVKGNFTYAALEVMFMQPGEVDVISPLDILPLFGRKTWLCHLIADVWVMVFRCQAIHLQPNWIYSRGAKIEVFIALLLGKEIIT